MRELREDQSYALQNMRDAVGKGHKRICMQAPTGFGKTVLAGAVVESARSKGKKVLFTVPAISLIDQTIEMFWHQGITEVGVIQASHCQTDWSQPVQIASVQTLMKRTMPEADIVLIDEVHRWFTAYEQWLSQDQGWQVPVIGLSATPWTKGLGNWFRGPFKAPASEQKQCHIIANTTEKLIELGLLSDFEVCAAGHPDLSEVKTVAGDYHEGQLSKVMQEGTLTADAVEMWQKLWGKDKTLLYAVDRAHAKALQLKFEAAGITCGYQDAYTKDHDRKALKRAFHSGELRVVANVGTLTTGIDWDVRCLSLNRPTKSDMLFVQIIGRVLRTAEGKDKALILDHSDNHDRLGFVTDIDQSYTALHEGKTPNHDNRTEGIRLPKECPQCHFLRSPRVSTCPQCGFKAEMVSSIRPDPGELRVLKRKPKTAKTVEELDRETFFAELKTHGMLKNYKPGWPAVQFKKKYGEFPPRRYDRIAPADNISQFTRNWIKHGIIAFVKGQANDHPRDQRA